jgi:hypothetical protein
MLPHNYAHGDLQLFSTRKHKLSERFKKSITQKPVTHVVTEKNPHQTRTILLWEILMCTVLSIQLQLEKDISYNKSCSHLMQADEADIDEV